MNNDINQFITLRASLQQERITLEARLKELIKALDQITPASTVTTAPTAPQKRMVSEATKAKIKQALQARWAAKSTSKPVVATAPAKVVKPVAAPIAKVAPVTKPAPVAKAAPTPVTKPVASAAAKPKQPMSTEARAKIASALKARWAKIQATKKPVAKAPSKATK